MLSGVWMGDSYLWLKTVHVLAVISWMAGLFYLPRLFVYHAEKGSSTEISGIFMIMERRLLKAIMRPAAAVSILSGAGLIWAGGWWPLLPGWLIVKLSAVALMLAFHGMLEMHTVKFALDSERHTGRYFRILNEVPTVLLVLIVISVIIKPF
jgi:protoporphyrinogen IX oxidase